MIYLCTATPFQPKILIHPIASPKYKSIETMSNVTCSTTFIPELASLPISDDTYYVITPGQNTSDAAMVACCSPNAVNIVDTCYLWCEVPSTYSDKDTVTTDFGNCLRQNGKNVTIIAANTSDSPSRTPTITGLTVMALAISFLASI